jgi:hypothetical protein
VTAIATRPPVTLRVAVTQSDYFAILGTPRIAPRVRPQGGKAPCFSRGYAALFHSAHPGWDKSDIQDNEIGHGT